MQHPPSQPTPGEQPPTTPIAPPDAGAPQPGGAPASKKPNVALIIIGAIIGVLVLACTGCGVLAAVFANRADQDMQRARAAEVPTLTAVSAQATQHAEFLASATPIATFGIGGSSTPGATTVVHHQVGETIVVNADYTVVLNGVKTDQGTAPFTPRTAGNIFLVVDVTITNTSSRSAYVSGYDFTLKDSTAQKYNNAFNANVTEPSGQLAPGERIRGQVAFEVPATEKAFTLTYTPTSFNFQAPNPVAIWDIAL